MKTHASHRGGFTLVELLVVLLIMAMLMALLTPAVMRARAAARTTAVKAEIDMLSMAIMNYKNEYGSFPPANMRGLWNTAGRVNTNHPVYRHLRKLFPRNTEREDDNGSSDRSPYYFMAQMSPAQALVFFLQGYYANPQFPLTNGVALSDAFPRAGTAAGTRAKLYDFDETRLRGATSYWAAVTNPPVPNFQIFYADRGSSITPAFARDYPVYFPSAGGGDLPYVYFSNTDYASSTAPTAGPTFRELAYLATADGGGNTIAWPYLRSNVTPSDSWGHCHWNPDGFQLIVAGIDNSYGGSPNDPTPTRPACFPAEFPFQSWASPSIGIIPIGIIPSVMSGDASYHADNITNFASGTLREAAEKLRR